MLFAYLRASSGMPSPGSTQPRFASRETVGVRCLAGVSLKQFRCPFPMAKHHGCVNAFVGCLIFLAACSGIAQNGESFKARLSTVPVDATMLPTVTGSGSLKAILVGNKLTITGTFSGMRSPAIRASIHIGPQKGIRGPTVHDLTVTNEKNGGVSGSLELTSSEVEDLRSGRLYVQIDSERAPDGNLWGWVLR